MLRNSNDLLLVGGIAVLAVLAVGLGSAWPLGQALLGWPLVLFLPGYALTAVLFSPRTLGVPERVLFSVALSLVITMLGSLALNGLRLGLRPVAWALLLTAVTLGACLAAWRRRQGRDSVPLPRNFLNPVQAGTLSLAGLVVVAAIALAQIPSRPARLEGYTLLWILPSDATQAPGVRLGVSSMEFTPMNYGLRVIVDGRVTYELATINLGPGEKWDGFLALPNPGAGLGKVEATLYRLDHPEVVYRRVTLWQDPAGQDPAGQSPMGLAPATKH